MILQGFLNYCLTSDLLRLICFSCNILRIRRDHLVTILELTLWLPEQDICEHTNSTFISSEPIADHLSVDRRVFADESTNQF